MLPNFHMYVCRYIRHRRLLCLVCTNVVTVMEDFLLICDTKKCHHQHQHGCSFDRAPHCTVISQALGIGTDLASSKVTEDRWAQCSPPATISFQAMCSRILLAFFCVWILLLIVQLLAQLQTACEMIKPWILCCAKTLQSGRPMNPTCLVGSVYLGHMDQKFNHKSGDLQLGVSSFLKVC